MPTNITALVHDYKVAHNIGHDVKVVEHQAKPGTPERVSLMIYGKGLAVVTLEKGNRWQISNMQHDNHYRNAKWPDAMTGEPTPHGALDIIAGFIECAQKHDGVI